jgi:hypothetical protein
MSTPSGHKRLRVEITKRKLGDLLTYKENKMC